MLVNYSLIIVHVSTASWHLLCFWCNLLMISDRILKERYEVKLQLINGADPYEILMGEWSKDVGNWPAITHVRASMYLILTHSPYSDEDMLNYKSLDSYRRDS